MQRAGMWPILHYRRMWAAGYLHCLCASIPFLHRLIYILAVLIVRLYATPFIIATEEGGWGGGAAVGVSHHCVHCFKENLYSSYSLIQFPQLPSCLPPLFFLSSSSLLPVSFSLLPAFLFPSCCVSLPYFQSSFSRLPALLFLTSRLFLSCHLVPSSFPNRPVFLFLCSSFCLHLFVFVFSSYWFSLLSFMSFFALLPVFILHSSCFFSSLLSLFPFHHFCHFLFNCLCWPYSFLGPCFLLTCVLKKNKGKGWVQNGRRW